jgi:hypothetical protein
VSFHLFSRVFLLAIEPVIGFLHTYGIVSQVEIQRENGEASRRRTSKIDRSSGRRRSGMALKAGVEFNFEPDPKGANRGVLQGMFVQFDQVLAMPCRLFLSRVPGCARVCQHQGSTNLKPAMINR